MEMDERVRGGGGGVQIRKKEEGMFSCDLNVSIVCYVLCVLCVLRMLRVLYVLCR